MATMTPSRIEERIEKALHSWKTLHEAKAFAKMTLAQFTARVTPSLDVREEIRKTEERLVQLKVERDTQADKESLRALESLINGVRADEEIGGDDSAFYKELGYIPQSERKTGLTRKKKVEKP
jgi:hypothetical protein